MFVYFQAFSAVDQLRVYSATQISELEKSLGSQQELLDALNKTYPEQVRRTDSGYSLDSMTSVRMMLI